MGATPMASLVDWSSFLQGVLAFEVDPTSLKNDYLGSSGDNVGDSAGAAVVPDCDPSGTGEPARIYMANMTHQPPGKDADDDMFVVDTPSVNPALVTVPVERTPSSMSIVESDSLPLVALSFDEDEQQRVMDMTAAQQSESYPASPASVATSPSTPSTPELRATSPDDDEYIPGESPIDRPRFARPQRPQRRAASAPRSRASRSIVPAAIRLPYTAPGSPAPTTGLGDMPLAEFRALIANLPASERDALKHRRRQEKNSSSQRRSRSRRQERLDELQRKNAAAAARKLASNK